MSTTGEKPGVGLYQCKKCGKVIALDHPEDRLPLCLKCNGSEFNDVL